MQTDRILAFSSLLPLEVLFCLSAGPVRSASAQELLGVDFAGTAHAVDLQTGARRVIGPTGATNVHAMARHDGTYLLAGRNGAATQIYSLDALTAVATLLVPNVGSELRGLCGRPGTAEFYAVSNPANGFPDRLLRFSLQPLTIVDVGSTGITNLQALEHDGTTLFGWDQNLGLVTIDELTGDATDANASLGNQGQSVQFLTRGDNGGLLAGNTRLFQALANGVLVAIGGVQAGDLRGAEVRNGAAIGFGVGCGTGAIGQSSLAITGSLLAGDSVQWFSTNHASLGLGVLAVGLSSTTAGGAALPLDVDPLLGTTGCRLLTSSEALFAGVANGFGVFDALFTLPTAPGAELHFQLVALDPVPGGLSFSNGVTVQMPR